MIRILLFFKRSAIFLGSGLIIAIGSAWMSTQPSLRGPHVLSFLAVFLVGAIAYGVSIYRLERDEIPIAVIWGFALLFRLILVTTNPSLSDDVYRYAWDGHLLNQGINPYTYPVESPVLDQFTVPIRSLVNHPWMASPYLPGAQILFGALGKLIPQNIKAYQVVMAVFDLGAGLIVMNILKALSLPRKRVLIYLWNPLVLIEFSHAAHIDAFMIFLITVSTWFAIQASQSPRKASAHKYASAIFLAAATLTKGIPTLLAPIFFRRWGIWRFILFSILILVVLSLFSIGAGLGLHGPLDGTGVFGATRIFMRYWNFNSSIYYGLEVLLSDVLTPGSIPSDMVLESKILWLRGLTSFGVILIAVGAGIWAWFLDDPERNNHRIRSISLLRLAVVPLGAYILLTHTVHPWYLTILIPFIPFLLPFLGETSLVSRFMIPWLYLSCAVAISYLTYLNPEDFREVYYVRAIEYIPFYGLLLWAAMPFIRQSIQSITDRTTV